MGVHTCTIDKISVNLCVLYMDQLNFNFMRVIAENSENLFRFRIKAADYTLHDDLL